MTQDNPQVVLNPESKHYYWVARKKQLKKKKERKQAAEERKTKYNARRPIKQARRQQKLPTSILRFRISAEAYEMLLNLEDAMNLTYAYVVEKLVRDKYTEIFHEDKINYL